MKCSLTAWSRVIWLCVGLATLALFVPSLAIAHHLLQNACAGSHCFDHQLTPRVAAEMERSGVSLSLYATYYTGSAGLFAAVWTSLGVLLVVRKPSDSVALFS